MVHELIKYSQDGSYENLCEAGGITWSSSEDTLGVKLEFDLGIKKADIGDLVVLRNKEKEIFRGVVISEEVSGESTRHYICFDYAFYLNKSKGIYQFKGLGATSAIGQLLGDFSVPVGGIAQIPTKITHIYHDKYISGIIKDILRQATEESGIKYRLEMREGKLFIDNQNDLAIKASFQLASNIAPSDIVNSISNPNRKRSIEDMKNSILVVINDKKSARSVGAAKDPTGIKKYGLLQEVKSIDEKDISKAKNIARNLLNDLNKIAESNSFECIGNDDVRAGRILDIKEPVTGMQGKYRVKACRHNLNNGIHTMSLSLGGV